MTRRIAPRRQASTESRLSRRGFVRGAGFGVLALGLGGGLTGQARHAAAGYWNDGIRRLALHNLWTEEYLEITYWVDGEYLQGPLEDFNYLLRDHHNGRVESIFYGVLDQLFWLRQALGTDAPIGVISGYRSPATNRWLRRHTEGVARNSLHTLGMAVDVRIERQDTEHVWRTATTLAMGGCGYYHGSDFVHLDVGPIRRWRG